MNSRAARRMATTRLAAAARYLSVQVGEIPVADGVTPADRIRLQRAFDGLAHELEVRVGITPRVPRAVPLDPDQEPLFEINRETGEDENHAGSTEQQVADLGRTG